MTDPGRQAVARAFARILERRRVRRLHRRTDAQLPVPAVVGKTVADFEQLERARDEALKEADHLRSGLHDWTRAAQDAERERDDARAEAEKERRVADECDILAAQAARYREALERIAAGENDDEWLSREDLRDLAREALGDDVASAATVTEYDGRDRCGFCGGPHGRAPDGE